ncbi:MAG: PGPGW domain-containing protein [Desulfobulbus sp.]|nr:PGPGW domain-containing protein [Desulfobulbus sp.]
MLQLLGLFSFVTFVGSLIVVPWLIGRMPKDYFIAHWHQLESSRKAHPALGLIMLILRNVFGVLLLVAGFAMLFLPGQGLLTMLIGLCLMDFPGKRHLMGIIVGKSSVQRGLNWMRRKRGKEEFAFTR